jgi:hypothetical protein
MPALMLRRATPVREGDSLSHQGKSNSRSELVRVLQAMIETLRAENEILERRLAAAEARAAARDRCPWRCRRIRPPNDPAHREVRREKRA